MLNVALLSLAYLCLVMVIAYLLVTAWEIVLRWTDDRDGGSF